MDPWLTTRTSVGTRNSNLLITVHGSSEHGVRIYTGNGRISGGEGVRAPDTAGLRTQARRPRVQRSICGHGTSPLSDRCVLRLNQQGLWRLKVAGGRLGLGCSCLSRRRARKVILVSTPMPEKLAGFSQKKEVCCDSMFTCVAIAVRI